MHVLSTVGRWGLRVVGGLASRWTQPAVEDDQYPAAYSLVGTNGAAGGTVFTDNCTLALRNLSLALVAALTVSLTVSLAHTLTIALTASLTVRLVHTLSIALTCRIALTLSPRRLSQLTCRIPKDSLSLLGFRLCQRH